MGLTSRGVRLSLLLLICWRLHQRMKQRGMKQCSSHLSPLCRSDNDAALAWSSFLLNFICHKADNTVISQTVKTTLAVVSCFCACKNWTGCTCILIINWLHYFAKRLSRHRKPVGWAHIIISLVSVWSQSNEPGNSCSHMLFWIIDAMSRCFHHSSSCRLRQQPHGISWRTENHQIRTILPRSVLLFDVVIEVLRVHLGWLGIDLCVDLRGWLTGFSLSDMIITIVRSRKKQINRPTSLHPPMHKKHCWK